MAQLEVTKSIEAVKLNQRSRLPLSEPPVTIPFGALLDNVVENRDLAQFMYLSELYQCKAEMLHAATHRLEGGAPGGGGERAGAATAPARDPVTFVWERLRSGTIAMQRAKLPGGWLIALGDSGTRSLTFYPDPDHSWNGETLRD